MDAFRKPTDTQQKRLEKGRKMIREGARDEKDLLSRLSTTSKYQARQAVKRGQEELDKVPEAARNYEAYQTMTQMKKGGKVKGYAAGGKIDGCARKGKTRGKMV